MKRHLFFLIVMLQCNRAFSQSILSGVVIDADDKKALQYVSIGLINTPDGTVSNMAGLFTLKLGSKIKDDDTLKFSSIGYQYRGFLVGELKAKMKDGMLTIALKKAESELKQVSVIAKKTTTKILGYPVNLELFAVGFNGSELGAQAGIVIHVKHADTYMQDISFIIVQNTFTHLTLRLNVYDLEGEKPGNNLLTDNIVIPISDRQTGKVTFDLTKYHLYFSKDVLLTLEWIEAKPASGNFGVAVTVFGHTYFRQASQYTWIKKGIGLGLSVKASY